MIVSVGTVVVCLVIAVAQAAVAATCAVQEITSPNGPGVRVGSDCSREEGQFFNGRLWGQGKYTSSQGTVSEGEFVDGRLHGIGKVTKPGTDGRYNSHYGYFQFGDPYGPGQYRYQDGVLATGMFHGQELMGFGVLYFPNGNKLMGEFRGGSGFGKMLAVYADGKTEEGEYRTLRYSLLRASGPARGGSSASPPAPSASPAPPSASPAPAPQKSAAPPAKDSTQPVDDVGRAIKDLRNIFRR